MRPSAPPREATPEAGPEVRLDPRPNVFADSQVGLVIRQQEGMNFKRLAMTPQEENNTPGQKSFPDVGNLGEDDAARRYTHEAARNPKAFLVNDYKSRKHVPPDRQEQTDWKSERACKDAEKLDVRRETLMQVRHKARTKTAIARPNALAAQVTATIFRDGL
jgi:hypothetical protein